VDAEAALRDGHFTEGAAPRAPTRKMCDGSLMDTDETLSKLSGRPRSSAPDHRSAALTSENGKVVSAVAERGPRASGHRARRTASMTGFGPVRDLAYTRWRATW
jgi:hypothetical protein